MVRMGEKGKEGDDGQDERTGGEICQMSCLSDNHLSIRQLGSGGSPWTPTM